MGRARSRDRPRDLRCFSTGRVRNDDDQVLVAHLLERVRAPRTCQDRGAWADAVLLAVERQLPVPAQYVVDLVFLLLVVTDPRPWMERAFAKREREVPRGSEEGIAG